MVIYEMTAKTQSPPVCITETGFFQVAHVSEACSVVGSFCLGLNGCGTGWDRNLRFAAEALDEFSEYTKENLPQEGCSMRLETSNSRGLRRTTANVFRVPPTQD